MAKTDYRDKARGMFVGLAVGDALGAPVEFGYNSASIAALGEKISHYQETPFGPAGTWTDDTSMALCIADSLLACLGYDSYDVMDRYCRWMREGYRTPDGAPAADVGNQTRFALNLYLRDLAVIPKSTPKTTSAGNGAIMRLAPVVIANTFPEKKYPTLNENQDKLAAKPEDDDEEYIELKDIAPTLKMAELSCRETHDSVAAITTTELFATTLYCALHGLKKNHIVSYCSRWMEPNKDHDEFWENNFDKLVERALESNGDKLRDLGGYIVDAFAIALWGLIHFDNFQEGMLAVVKLGGDTDTNAAIYGQLAGAYYGYETIPEEWRKDLYLSDEITEIADQLLAMKECPILRTRFEDDEHFEAPAKTPTVQDTSPSIPQSLQKILEKHQLKKN